MVKKIFCDICGKDITEDYYLLDIYNGISTALQIHVCSKCKKKIIKMVKEMKKGV